MSNPDVLNHLGNRPFLALFFFFSSNIVIFSWRSFDTLHAFIIKHLTFFFTPFFDCFCKQLFYFWLLLDVVFLSACKCPTVIMLLNLPSISGYNMFLIYRPLRRRQLVKYADNLEDDCFLLYLSFSLMYIYCLSG